MLRSAEEDHAQVTLRATKKLALEHLKTRGASPGGISNVPVVRGLKLGQFRGQWPASTIHAPSLEPVSLFWLASPQHTSKVAGNAAILAQSETASDNVPASRTL